MHELAGKSKGIRSPTINRRVRTMTIKSKLSYLIFVFYRVSQKTCPAFERLLLPEYISNDTLQYLIE